MGAPFWRTAKAVASVVGLVAGLFADLPDLFAWLFAAAGTIAALMAQEPIGSLAMAGLIGYLIAQWWPRRGPPIL